MHEPTEYMVPAAVLGVFAHFALSLVKLFVEGKRRRNGDAPVTKHQFESMAGSIKELIDRQTAHEIKSAEFRGQVMGELKGLQSCYQTLVEARP